MFSQLAVLLTFTLSAPPLSLAPSSESVPVAVPASVSEVLDASFDAWARDDVLGALALVSDHLRDETARLAQLDGEAASALADELEVLLVWFARLSALLGNPPLERELLAGIEVAREHGALFGRLAWRKARVLDDLAPLLDWELVGPFDNERGQGMLRPTPAEIRPADESYDGKVREVAWRALPDVAPRAGIVHVSQLIDPSQQTCVVARTWIESADARDVVLLLGASEEVRVCLDGKTMFEALGEHAFSSDGFAVPLSLVPGWNELTLKVGSHDRSLVFCARLVDSTSGAPLDLPVRASAPEGVAPKMGGGRIQDRPAFVRPGAWRRYADAQDAEGCFRRGLLEQDAQVVPRHMRPGLASFDEALRLAPATARYETWRITALRESGASRVEEDINPWLAAIDAALARHGELPFLLRARARHAWGDRPTYDEALALCDRALSANPDSIPAQVDRVRVLTMLRQAALADAARNELADAPQLSSWARFALDVARSLPVGDLRRRPLIAVARHAGMTDALELELRERRLRTGDRSAETTLAALGDVLAQHPWSVGSRLRAAEQLVAQGHPSEALAVLDDALGFAPERPALHKWRARALLALGETELAAGALEEELQFAYGADDERRLLEHLMSLGGEPFHEAFREPLEDVLARRASDTPANDRVAGREVLLSRMVVEINPDGTAKRYRRSVERVLNEAGARELDQRVFRAYAGEEEIRLLSAVVRRSDGTLDEARTGRSGRRGYVYVDLPPLEPGDIVDLEWRHDDLRTSYFGNYFGLDARLTPDTTLPVRESEVVLIVPASFPLHFHQRAFEAGGYEHFDREDGGTLHRWTIAGLDPRPSEPLMPPASEDAPAVQASSYASWEDFGGWWWNLIEDEIRVSPEMATKVAELTADAASPLDKLRAIYDFVVTDVRYNAWEFGVHGYQPYSAPVIFSRRFGDCKDKAILLKAMLGEAGIEAWPVLIRLESRRFEEDHELALVSHFNHCIAYVPEQDGLDAMYLDGTARLHPLEVLPDADRGARVVVVRDDGVFEDRVPFAEAGDNTLRHSITVDMTGDEGARVEYVRRATGRWDPGDRQRFTGNAEEREEEVERLLTSLFGALSGDVEARYPDFEDLSAPVEVHFEVGVEQVSRPTDDGFELPTTFEELDLLRGLASETERETDLLLDVPWTRETEIEYVLGSGERPKNLPALVEIDTPDASYSRTVEPTARGVRVRERFALKTHRVARDSYREFREVCRAVDDAQRESIAVEVGQ